MPYLKRINSLPLINHISYKYAQVSDIGPSWSSCFSSPEHRMLTELLRLLTVRRCPSVRSVQNFLVYTLASTNINQSTANLVKIYMTIRSRMSFIMELIGPDLFELSALEFEYLPYLILFTL